MSIIYVLGGVISGLGKGVTCGSMGAILKEMGYKINIKKNRSIFKYRSWYNESN